MKNNQFGFEEGDLDTIIRVFSNFPEIETAIIFGSRAKGNYQHGSDVDLAIQATDGFSTGPLHGVLNDETPLPYKFDILDYNKIDNKELKEHIDRAGIEIYRNHSLAGL